MGDKKEKKLSASTTIVDSKNLQIDQKAKPKEFTGSLDEEVKRLKDSVHLAVFVLFIGFAAVFVAVFLFAIQALHERNATYNSLLEKVDVLEAKIDNTPQVIISKPTK